jgi:NADPH:quinone reductase-like Zn-dependent oxidoreductase
LRSPTWLLKLLQSRRYQTKRRVFGGGMKAVRLYRYGGPENREFAEDIRDGKFLLPISLRLPLQDAREAHALAQKGSSGKIILVV